MRSVNLRRMILLLIPSFTLAALLFISFPRFTRGFLNTGAPSIVTSGHSNSINFQELGPLTMTNNIAFKFYQHNSDIKMDAQSYWRVSVLWHYDGKNWIASNQNLKAPYQSIKNGKQSYSIELKSHNGPYLPILDSPSSLDLIPFMYTPFLDGTFLISINNKMDRNFNILSEYPNVFSNANSLMRMKGLKVNTKNLLRIKEKYLPSSLSLNDDERLEQLITSFKSKPFSYSLNPPPYSSMEDFLLNGTLGYCSHFAPGFAYLARLFNLPSRVVTGYLGNETNPYDNSIIIRESDAHAWVEVLLKERGWVRVDPTLFIAPERGRMSAADFNDQINPYFTIFNIKISKSLLRFPFINESSLLLDSINSRFNNFVFNFDKETQASLLGYFSKSKFTFSILIALVFCFFISFYFIFIKISKNQKNKKHIKKYRSFLKKMAHQGLLKKKEETAIEFAERATRSIPTQKDVIAKATQEYINFEYRKD